jgi:uncharacterized membrane protein YphA (DoxX/SURF4 family)
MIKNLEKYSKPILRISLALVFLWFGYQQVFDVGSWIGYVPTFALNFGLSAESLVIINGIVELILGGFLLIGFYTRTVALILALNLFVITFGIGFNEIGVRDFGLAFATLVVFLNGVDDFCLSKQFAK